jgi:hypothetical protein
MGKPEVTGNKPKNHGLSEFSVLPEKRGLSPLAKKPEESNQQPSDPDVESSEQMLRKRRRSVVAGGEGHHRTYDRLMRAKDRIDSANSDETEKPEDPKPQED